MSAVSKLQSVLQCIKLAIDGVYKLDQGIIYIDLVGVMVTLVI